MKITFSDHFNIDKIRAAVPLLAIFIFFSGMAAFAVLLLLPEKYLISVGLTGVHHMGEKFSVSEFYINEYSGGNIGREGGGGSTYCCIMLPQRWRPGLVGDIRWSVSDWTQENLEETIAGNYNSIRWKTFRAIVPIEKYEGDAGRVYVHFFMGGKVRVVASEVGPGNSKHPIQENDSHAVAIATQGIESESLFSDSEIAKLLAKHESGRKGDWR